MEQLYTIDEAARLLSVHRDFLRQLQRRGQLRTVRIGHTLGATIRVTESELQRLLRNELGQPLCL